MVPFASPLAFLDILIQMSDAAESDSGHDEYEDDDYSDDD